MEQIIRWDAVEKDRWTYQWKNENIKTLIFQLSKLPNFTDQRFGYLGKETDKRAAEVAKKQMQMIRAFHNLGSSCGISFRLVKDKKITAYLMFRYSETVPVSEQAIQSMLMREYSFKRVDNDLESTLNWANDAAEILKLEKIEQGTVYPHPSMGTQTFYSSYMWTPADNNMEYICAALMSYSGKAAVEVTLVPHRYLEEEKDWLNTNAKRIKESMNGETFKDNTGRVIWKGEPIPVLKTPLENCEKMDKQYETGKVFLSSIRVFTEGNARNLADAFAVNSVKSKAQIITGKKGDTSFRYLTEGYRKCDISVQLHNGYWDRYKDEAPFRAQRFQRLVSVEEIANFFRIPIPVNDNFPGFEYDTGLSGARNAGQAGHPIQLGEYLDEHGRSEKAFLDAKQFAKHGLIVGVPGSGKTTAMFQILYQLWAVPEESRIPFIILEPAKTEYRALKTLPVFSKDMLVFSLGDEGTSPFRFNPMEVMPGIRLENHISKLQACFVGAFDLFDPLPIFLEQAIRRTYEEKGWYDDSVGGEPGLDTPTLADLCRNAEYVVAHSGFDSKMRSDFQASLLERLNSLRKGSKGRMLDTAKTIPMEELMERPIVMELDSLNSDEKALMMMFLLNYVFEYCKVKRKSGSPLKHMLLVEEAHNLIPSGGSGNENRANPKQKTIELFVNMLAEMRSLGEGILIADQLPTAIAPQAVKQTNVKLLMRVTAKDDREEIGNSMDLNEEQMHQVVNFKTGHAYLYHEGEDHVRLLRMANFKGEHQVEEPPSDEEMKQLMSKYEDSHRDIYLPFKQCASCCSKCDRRVRNQAEQLVKKCLMTADRDPYVEAFGSQAEKMKKAICLEDILLLNTKKEADRICNRYGTINEVFGACVFVHGINQAEHILFDEKGHCIGGSKTERNDKEKMQKFSSVTRKELK